MCTNRRHSSIFTCSAQNPTVAILFHWMNDSEWSGRYVVGSRDWLAWVSETPGRTRKSSLILPRCCAAAFEAAWETDPSSRLPDRPRGITRKCSGSNFLRHTSGLRAWHAADWSPWRISVTQSSDKWHTLSTGTICSVCLKNELFMVALCIFSSCFFFLLILLFFLA